MAVVDYDLSILYADDAEGWKTYFKSTLGENKTAVSLSVNSVSVGTLHNVVIRRKICGSTCQLILVSPELVDQMKESADISLQELIRNPSGGILLFLSVEEEEWATLGLGSFADYSRYTKLYMPENNDDITVEYLKTICAQVIDIYETVHANRDPIKKKPPKPAPKPKPKKTPKAVETPNTVEDKIPQKHPTVISDSPNRIPETSPAPSPRSSPLPEITRDDVAAREFRLVEPKTITPNRENIVMLMNSRRDRHEKFESSRVKITMVSNNQTFTLKFSKYTSYTFVASVPSDCPCGQYQLNFLFDDVVRASSVIQVVSNIEVFREALYQSTNPLQLIADTLDVDSSNRIEIDQKLYSMLDSTFPDESIHMCRIFNQYFEHDESVQQTSMKELPTMLHFAAKFGLEKFCCRLMECPGANLAFSIDNVNGDYPPDIAEKAGYPDLAVYLEEVLEMAPVINVINRRFQPDTYAPAPCASSHAAYVQSDSHYINRNGPSSQYINQGHYDLPANHKPDHYGDIYSRVSNEPDYMTMGGRAPDYLPMSGAIGARQPALSPRQKEIDENDVQELYLECEMPLSKPAVRAKSFKGDLPPIPSDAKARTSTLPANFKQDNKAGGIMGTPVPSQTGSQTNDSILEINQGVAKGEYTLDEAESLFKALQRGPTGDSVKERQKNLQALRAQYGNVIESVNKDCNKKPGWWARLRGKKKQKNQGPPEPKIEHLCGKAITQQVEEIPEDVPFCKISKNRASNASLSSNGSRSSTISSCSAGRDSGSFSGNDHEDASSQYGATYDQIEQMPAIDEIDKSPPPVTRRNSDARKQSAQHERKSLRSEILLREDSIEPPPRLPPRPPRPLPSASKDQFPSPSKSPSGQKKKLGHALSMNDMGNNPLFKKQINKNVEDKDIDESDSDDSLPDFSPPPPPPRSKTP